VKLLVDTIAAAMKQHLKNYCQESSIHGLSYIVKKDLHVSERVIWILAMIASFACCGFLISEIAERFHKDLLVTYTSDTTVAVIDVSRSSKEFR
jgi:hypothetical protein